MPRKHHRRHLRQEKEVQGTVTDDDNKSDLADDDAASNSTADSLADHDDSSQDCEDRVPEPTGIKLVLKMNASESGMAPEYSPSHVYSPSGHDDKRRKHKKKKKKKSSDREKHRYYQDKSPQSVEGDDQQQKRVTPFRITSNTALNYCETSDQSDDETESCDAKKPKLEEADDEQQNSADDEKNTEKITEKSEKVGEDDNQSDNDNRDDDYHDNLIDSPADNSITTNRKILRSRKTDQVNESGDTIRFNVPISAKKDDPKVTISISEDDLNVSYDDLVDIPEYTNDDDDDDDDIVDNDIVDNAVIDNDPETTGNVDDITKDSPEVSNGIEHSPDEGSSLEVHEEKCQNSPEVTNEENSPVVANKENSPEVANDQNSPEVTNDQNSPEDRNEIVNDDVIHTEKQQVQNDTENDDNVDLDKSKNESEITEHEDMSFDIEEPPSSVEITQNIERNIDKDQNGVKKQNVDEDKFEDDVENEDRCEDNVNDKNQDEAMEIESQEEKFLVNSLLVTKSDDVISENLNPEMQNLLKTEDLDSVTSQGSENQLSGYLGVVNAPAVEEVPSKLLKPLLNHLHKSLTKYDVHGIFAFPVNDLIAPGYSSIIETPMDFSTMAQKISAGVYPHAGELKKDFELMCNNAMAYNQSETIYYKEAARILQTGSKFLSRDKLLKTVRTQGFLNGVTTQELGIDLREDKLLKTVRTQGFLNGVTTRELGIDLPEAVVPLERLSQTEISQHTVPSPAPSQQSVCSTNDPSDEAIRPDEPITTDDILAQAQAAARGAADRLTMRKPNSKFGFLRRRDDGSTSFNIVNPDNDGMVSETERHVDIGSLLSKPPGGTTSLAGYKEDRRNKVTTINYLNYGPFSSYGPQYDSSFANVSKDESDLLLSTYKDDVGVSYAESVLSFVDSAGDYGVKMVNQLLDMLTKGNTAKHNNVLSFVDSAGDYAVKMVNQLLDMLTKGEHSKTQQVIEENKRLAEEELQKLAAKDASMEQSTIDFDSLESLSDLGIDTSFLTSFKSTEPIQQQLDQSAKLINDLEKTQNERLSEPAPDDLNKVATPSAQELKMANEVREKLKDMSKQIGPGDISSAASIHKAMGITPPIETPDTGSHATHQTMETSVTKPQDNIQMELEKLLDDNSVGNSNFVPPTSSANIVEQMC